MKLENLKTVLIVTVLSFMSLSACATQPMREVASTSWSNYQAVGTANWKNQSHRIAANSGNGFLVSPDQLQNFYLKVEFLAGPNTNSGIFFRCSDQKNINDHTCYEANIFDTRPDQSFRTGAITGHKMPKVIINTEDQNWHVYEIYADGDKIKVLIDGNEAVFMRDQKHSSGFIAFQLAQGSVQFKNLVIQSLEPQEANDMSELDGVWELESMSSIDKDGKATPWCVGAYGVIMYFDGYMSTAVNCTTDPNKIVLYSGPFHIENQTVFHHVQNFSQPSLSKIHVRIFYRPDQNHLELSGQLGDGKVLVKWVRR